MTTLRDAVRNVLVAGGTNILHDSVAFREALTSSLDAASLEAKLLQVGCDDQFVSCFSDAVEIGSSKALEEASERAAAHLVDTYVADAEAAADVSCEISLGCADFLGLEHRGRKTKRGMKAKSISKPKGRGTVRTVAIAVAVFAVLAVIIAAVASHFVPYLGCTVSPVTGTVDEIEYSWYKATSDNGGTYTMLFAKNIGDDYATLGSSRNTASDARAWFGLAPGEEALAVLQGDNGMDGVSVRRNEPAIMHIDNMTWSIKRYENGGFRVILENTNDIETPILHDCTIAMRGTTAGSISIPLEMAIEARGSDAIFSDRIARDGIPVGDDLIVDDDCELYVNGVKVPHA